MRELILNKGFVALVDDEDYEYLSQFKWNVNGGGYAEAWTPMINGKRRRIKMHREIIKASNGLIVDHINHNCLDNRKENLRLCSHAESMMNRRKPNKSLTSQFKGVSFNTQMGKWKARIKANKRDIHLGYFDDEVEAAKAYNKACIELHGEYACVNVIEEPCS
jgi:hypothetical protein